MNNKELYSTEKIYDGPWLLDAKALKELDLILASQWKLLERRRKTLIENDVETEARKYAKPGDKPNDEAQERIKFIRENHSFSKSLRLITIFYEDSVFRCDSFDQAFRYRGAENKTPMGAAIKLDSAGVECNINLESNKLHIRVTPEELDESQNLFIEIRGWAESHKPAWWQNWWGKLADARILFYAIIFGALFFAFVITNLSQGSSASSDIYARAEDLLKDDSISEPEMPVAIELLLRRQILDRLSLVFPSWLKISFGIAAILSVLLPFRPKIVLGIGKGIKTLQNWRAWHRIVIAILGIILTYLVYPGIASLFLDFLRRF